MTEHLEYHKNCRACFHKYACEAWINHGIFLYDNYSYDTEGCPYFCSADAILKAIDKEPRFMGEDDGYD